MTTAIVPQSIDKLGNNKLFKFGGYNPLKAYGPDRIAFKKLKSEFRKKGEEISTIDTVDIESIDTCIFVDIDYDYLSKFLAQSNPPTLIYVMREPPSIIPENSESCLIQLATLFDAVVTWNSSLTDLDKFWEYNIPQYMKTNHNTEIDFYDRSLLVNISSRKYSNHPEELYSKRQSIIDYYEDNHPSVFRLYGKYWNRWPRPGDIYYHQKITYREYETYRGLVDSKTSTYQDFRFALCFENMTGINGYITEKIFDCLRAGTVPIYWGADDITDYIPEECFIDYRNFGAPAALHEYIHSVSESEYTQYLEASKKFLSDPPKSISPTQYGKTLYKVTRAAREEDPKPLPPDIRKYILRRGKEERFIKESQWMSFPKYLQNIIIMAQEEESTKRDIDLIARSLKERYF